MYNIRRPLQFVASLAIAVLATQPSARAQHVSVSSGDWSSPSTWNTRTVPNSASAVIIRHDVVISEDVAVGPVSNGSSGLRIEGPGMLRVEGNANLTARADIVLDDAPLVIRGGSSLVFEPAGNGTPIRLQIGAADLQRRARLVLDGTRAASVTVASTAPGGGQLTDGGYRGGGLVTGAFCTLRGVGDASTAAITASPAGDQGIEISHCVLESGGAVVVRTAEADAPVRIENSTWRNTRADIALQIEVEGPAENGSRSIGGNAFDQRVHFHPSRGLRIRDNVFFRGFSVSPDAERVGWAEFRGNLIRNEAVGEHLLAGSSVDNYWFTDPVTIDENPHFVQALTFGSHAIDGDIFEYAGDADDGDAIVVGLPTEAATLEIRNVIVLPNAANENSGTLFSALGNSNVSIIAEHNTSFSGTQGAAVGETYAGHAGMVRSFRSNLSWSSGGRGFALFDSGIDENVVDLIAADALDYNAHFDLAQPYENLEFSNGLPGAHDLVADPEFVDASRDMAAWDAALGGPGTAEHAIQQLMNPDRFDRRSEYFIAGLRHFVREGFRPQNLAYLDAAHDGSTPGAVPFDPAPAPEHPSNGESAGENEDDAGGEPGGTAPELSAPRVRILQRANRNHVVVRMMRHRRARYRAVMYRAGEPIRRRVSKRPRIIFPRVRPGTYTVKYSIRRKRARKRLESAPTEFVVSSASRRREFLDLRE